MISKLIRYAVLASVVGLGVAACERAIATENQTSGDTEKVIGTPNDAEALISTYYRRWHTGLYGTTGDLEGMANVMSMMNFSSLANECQNSHFPFSGAINGNLPGNTCGGNQYRLYQVLGEVERVASNLLTQMDDKTHPLVLGNTDPKTDARDLRARSFAEFLRGVSLGYVALMHDSGAVISPGMTGTDPGKLVYYTEVMDSAYAALQRAIDYAVPAGTITNPTAGFPLPTSWYPRATPTSATEWVKVIKSYRARFRANVARTPAERAAADWTKVIADAQGGITADEMLVTSTTTGPSNAWRQQYESFTTWHQMPPFFIGMGDGGTSYATWIATPLTDRGAGNVSFFMNSPDKRFPQGVDRATQQADFKNSTCAGATQACKRYFVNRDAANDQFSGPGWGWSNYDFTRFHSWQLKGDGTARNGATTFFTLSELNMLQAEGLYRTGNYAGAAALINLSRTSVNGVGGTIYDLGGQLPAIGGTQASIAPGGAACVPKVPTPAGAVVCGDLWEALKYEKRIETAYTAFSNWYLDGRGWGDLAKDTPTFWAVPYNDLQARGRPVSALYGTGPGAGNAPNSTAAVSVYGW